MTQSNLYPTRHATTGRTGMIDGLTTATGRVGWSVATGKEATPFLPAEVLIWQGLPLVCTYQDLSLFDATGKPLWQRRKQGGTPAGVATNGLLYFKNPSLFIDAVDIQNKQILKSAPFPGAMGPEVRVPGFWPGASEFVAVAFDEPPTESRLGPPGPPSANEGPRLTIIRNRYPTAYGDMLKRFPGSTGLAPILVPSKPVVALALNGDVVRVDVAKKAELPRFKFPVADPVDWSVDADEVYVITGYDHQHKVVAAISGTGETLWRWEDTIESDTWAKLQPPIRFGTDRVYALTEGRVLAIESGRLVWAYDLRSEALRHGARVDDGSFEVKDGRLLAKGALRHGSALADGSVLVTSGKSLFHISAKGSKLFSVDLPEEILSAPVVGGNGVIYVATATHLVQIK